MNLYIPATKSYVEVLVDIRVKHLYLVVDICTSTALKLLYSQYWIYDIKCVIFESVHSKISISNYWEDVAKI